MTNLNALKPLEASTQIEKFNKISDHLALLAVYRSGAAMTNVIIKLKPNSDTPAYCQERSKIVMNLITASIAVEDLHKLESDDNVLSWNCAKSTKILK